MNDQNLDIIINNYIEKFEEIKSGETYKWVAVQHFQNNWDINADDFGLMFKNAVAATINMVSNRVVQPTSGIIELAKYDTDSVRELFIELFADDGGDLGARQSRIDDFVARADELLQKYAAGKWKFTQDVRAAITYLCLRFPDENYIFKSTPAHTFAKYIDYGHDIGRGNQFKLSNYYQMCEQIVNHISSHHDLLDINIKRLDDTTWPDTKYHLLASDIIFCASGYTLFGDIKIHETNKVSIAAKTKDDLTAKLETEMSGIESALNDIRYKIEQAEPIDLAGAYVEHKKFGTGEIIFHDNKKITVSFGTDCKIFGLPDVITNKSMEVKRQGVKVYYEKIAELLDEEKRLETKLSLARVQLNTGYLQS